MKLLHWHGDLLTKGVLLFEETQISVLLCACKTSGKKKECNAVLATLSYLLQYDAAYTGFANYFLWKGVLDSRYPFHANSLVSFSSHRNLQVSRLWLEADEMV